MPAPVITPPGPLVLSGTQTQLFAADQPVTWACSAGTITSGGLYTAPQSTGTHTITAQNGGGETSAPALIAVTADLLYTPGHASRFMTKKHVEVSQGARRRWTRRKSNAYRWGSLELPDRSSSECAALTQLWDNQYPEKHFYWTDPYLGQQRKFYFNSKLQVSAKSFNVFDIKFEIIEKIIYTFSPLVISGSVFPYAPSYAVELEFDKEINTSDAPAGQRAAEALTGIKRRYELTFSNRLAPELLASESFWDKHYPGKDITFADPLDAYSGTYTIDSEFEWQYVDFHYCEYKFVIREV